MPPSVDRLLRIAGRHIRPGVQHGPNCMLGLADVVQPLLTRVGEGLGYDAGKIVIDHGGKDIP